MGGESSLILDSEKGSEKVDIPVESVAIPVEGKPKEDGDRTGGVVGGIVNDSDDDEVLQQLRKVTLGLVMLKLKGPGESSMKTPKWDLKTG